MRAANRAMRASGYPETVAKAVPARSADAIKVALPRSGKVLQRSRNRFDSPMARRGDPRPPALS